MEIEVQKDLRDHDPLAPYVCNYSTATLTWSRVRTQRARRVCMLVIKNDCNLRNAAIKRHNKLYTNATFHTTNIRKGGYIIAHTHTLHNHDAAMDLWVRHVTIPSKLLYIRHNHRKQFRRGGGGGGSPRGEYSISWKHFFLALQRFAKSLQHRVENQQSLPSLLSLSSVLISPIRQVLWFASLQSACCKLFADLCTSWSGCRKQ